MIVQVILQKDNISYYVGLMQELNEMIALNVLNT